MRPSCARIVGDAAVGLLLAARGCGGGRAASAGVILALALVLGPVGPAETAPPEARAVVKSDIEYGRAGGVRLLLNASVPDNAGPHPMVIIVHGGGWGSGDKQQDTGPITGPLTGAHFTWFSINYRLAPEHRWPACFEDVQTAIRWVKAHAADYRGDPGRIALLGYSAGGQLACLAAVRAEEDTRVQAVVGLAPPTDLPADTERRGGLSRALQDLLDRPERVDAESRAILQVLSPITHVKPGMPPFLLVHGTADKSVPYSQSVNFRRRIEEVGGRCDLVTIADAPHAIRDWGKADSSYQEKVVAWLRRTLGPPAAIAEAPATPPAARTAKTRIVLAGDSTVTGDAGWGGAFARLLDGGIECRNLSRGGRSSRSFVAEGLWKECLDLKPDYVLIQFGHNDQPGHGPDRETDPETSFRENIKRYIEEARAAGAKPVLVTPLTRRQFGADGKIHSTLTPYADVVKRIAAEMDVPLVDLHARSIALCESLGVEGCKAISPPKPGGLDGTHLNAKGSQLVAPLVADELRRAVPALARLIRPGSPAPGGSGKTITVAADGGGDYKTVQEALLAVPDDSPERTVLHIKPGRYLGPILVPRAKSKVTFEGDDAEKTILTYGLNVYESQEDQPGDKERVRVGLPRSYRGIGVVILGDDFHAERITFENTSGDHGQALALRIDGDRAALVGCRMLGWQDTLMVNKGRQYFRDCYIEGRVDFIYGDGTAVFDRCEIRSKNGGYVTAASTPQDQPFGFVFLRCRLTGDPTSWSNPYPAPDSPSGRAGPPKAALGRPWRPYASVTFLDCEMGDHIKPEGWDNWGKPDNEKTARYAEFESTGPGAQPGRRVAWSRQLSAEEAGRITVEAVLAGSDGWKPGE